MTEGEQARWVGWLIPNWFLVPALLWMSGDLVVRFALIKKFNRFYLVGVRPLRSKSKGTTVTEVRARKKTP